MIELQMDGTIIAANENYLRAFGFTAEEVVGKKHSIFTTQACQESEEYRQFWARLRVPRGHSGGTRNDCIPTSRAKALRCDASPRFPGPDCRASETVA